MTTERPLMQLAAKLRHDFDVLDESERKRLLRELIAILSSTLLAVVGLVWLVMVTDLALARAELPALLLMGTGQRQHGRCPARSRTSTSRETLSRLTY